MKKKGQVYKSILGSYILILLIPVLIVVFLYNRTYHTMREQAEFYTDNLASTIQGICDRELAYYRSFLIQLKLEEAVRELATEELDGSPDEYWNTYLVQQELLSAMSSMRDSASHCLNIFIYLKDVDKIVTNDSGMDMRTYCQIYHDEAQEEQLREVLHRGDAEEIICYRAETGKVYILLLEPALGLLNRAKENAVLGLWLDVELLDLRIQSVSWESGMDWGLLDSNKEFLRAPEKIDLNSLSLESEIEELHSIDVDEEKYLVNLVDSEEYNWKYVLFIPEKQVSDGANQMKNLYLISVIVIMIVGCWCARVFTQHHYNPLKDLMTILNKDSDAEVKNEYHYMGVQIASLIQSCREYQKDVSKSNRAIRNYVVEEMLTSAVIEEKNLVICEEAYQKFRDGDNLVVICSIKEKYDDAIPNDKGLDNFIIKNVCDELVGKIFPCESLELEKRIVIILDTTQCGKTYSENLKSIYEYMREFVEQHLQFSVCMVEGGCYHGIAGIHQSYLEACEAEKFMTYLEDGYIRYEDIRDLSVRKYDYSFETEERLFHAVRTCNAKLACSYVRNVLENNFMKEPKPAEDMLTCLLYDIFGTLIKASEEKGITRDRMMIQGHISASSSMEEINDFFTRLVNELCEEAESRSTHGEILCKRVLDFICKNYTDPELNASQTALHFNMAPSYLSYVYKKQTGESIADVIKKMRVKYAKTLLGEGMSVVEVSQKVGFRECSTFIRTFKSVTGVTPGKIKELAEIEKVAENKMAEN